MMSFLSHTTVTLNIPGIYGFIYWEKGSNKQFLFPPSINICPSNLSPKPDREESVLNKMEINSKSASDIKKGHSIMSQNHLL